MRAIALIAALAMLASLFLPWLGATTFAGSATPWAVISQISPDIQALRDFTAGAPSGLLVVMLTLLLAGVFVLASALGFPSRPLALFTGGLVIGIIGFGLWQIRQGNFEAASIGLPLARDMALGDMAQTALATFKLGAWCWGIGGLLLFLSGTIGYGDRR